MTLDMLAFARDMDRLTRVLHMATRPGAKRVDHARVGPFGAMILMTIADNEPLPVQTLARLLARDKAQMTRAVQMLERHALVERRPSPEDGRVSLISLTEAGHELVTGFGEVIAEALTDLFGPLGDTEMRQFAATLEKLVSLEMRKDAPGR